MDSTKPAMVCCLRPCFRDMGCEKFIESMIVVNMYVENNATHFVCVDESTALEEDDIAFESVEYETYTLGKDAFYFFSDAIAFLLAENTADAEIKEHLIGLIGYTDDSLMSNVILFMEEKLTEFDYETANFCDIGVLSDSDNVCSFRDVKNNKRFDICVICMPDKTERCMFSYVNKYKRRELANSLKEAIDNYHIE